MMLLTIVCGKLYEIEVRSDSTITWVIYRRYNKFYDLHQELSKLKQNVPSLANVPLPVLPPKKYTLTPLLTPLHSLMPSPQQVNSLFGRGVCGEEEE